MVKVKGRAWAGVTARCARRWCRGDQDHHGQDPHRDNVSQHVQRHDKDLPGLQIHRVQDHAHRELTHYALASSDLTSKQILPIIHVGVPEALGATMITMENGEVQRVKKITQAGSVEDGLIYR